MRLEEISEVSTIRRSSRTPLKACGTPLTLKRTSKKPRAGPLAEVTKTVRNVRNDIRDGLSADETTELSAQGRRAPRARCADPVTKAVTDVTNAVRAGKPSKAARDATNAPTAVAKSLGDTARKASRRCGRPPRTPVTRPRTDPPRPTTTSSR